MKQLIIAFILFNLLSSCNRNPNEVFVGEWNAKMYQKYDEQLGTNPPSPTKETTSDLEIIFREDGSALNKYPAGFSHSYTYQVTKDTLTVLGLGNVPSFKYHITKAKRREIVYEVSESGNQLGSTFTYFTRYTLTK